MSGEFDALLARANALGIVPTHYDVDSDGVVYEVRTQDVEPLLRERHEAEWTGESPYSESRDLLAISEMPFVVAEQWCYARGVNPRQLFRDDDLVKKLVNDPDNRAWRRFHGRW